MRSKTTLSSFLLAAGSSLLAVSSSHAALETAFWDGSSTNGDANGGTGTWNSVNTNWDSLATAGADIIWDANASGDDTAIFGGTAATVTLSGTIALKNLTINTPGYTITGGTLAFSSGGTITVPNPPNNTPPGATISSNITGAPAVNLTPMDGDEPFTFNAPANGSMVIGNVTGDAAGNGSNRIYFGGGSGSISSVGTVSGPKTFWNGSGQWTLSGVANGYAHEILSGTLIVSTGTLWSTNRSTLLSGANTILHLNNAGAIRDGSATFNGGNHDFMINGGSIDQTSGAAITTSTHNPDMVWGGNWTFIGTNGANSNLFLGNGRVALTATRQVTVTNAAASLAVGGVISGATFGLTKAGAGTLELRGATSIYTGATSVSAGTLAITGTGSINSTSGISVSAGATFRYNSSTALTVAPALAGNGTSNRAVLGGTGTINTTITLNNLGDVLSPGNSPGIQNFTPNQTWSSFSYDWELNDWTAAVAGTNFDQIGITGTLNLNGGSGSYVLNVLGLTAGNATGSTPNFSETDRSWTILTSSGLTGFDAANWTINTAGFANPDSGTWVLAQSGNNLVLSYTAVPETQVGLFGGIGALMLLRRRRR